MEYIKKQNNEPNEWGISFFVDGIRRFDYLYAQNNGANLTAIKDKLIIEQNHLCAYCQKKITKNNSSIEHVIPKSLNNELSTDYYNLVVVCDGNSKSQGNGHCDKSKLDYAIVPFIFLNDSTVTEKSSNKYFKSYADGSIAPKEKLPSEIKNQVDSFIKILNLNHEILKSKRKNALDAHISAYNGLRLNKNSFWKNKLKNSLFDTKLEYRQYMLIYFASKSGIN